MSGNSLGFEIYNKIQHYLEKDNPGSRGFLDSIYFFFKARGSSGRERAREYWASLSEMDERSMRDKVWSDVCQPLGRGALGSSRKLRSRLLEGLCNHYQVPGKRVDRFYRQQMCLGLGLFDAAARPPSACTYFNAMKAAIKEKFEQLGFLPSVQVVKTKSP